MADNLSKKAFATCGVVLLTAAACVNSHTYGSADVQSSTLVADYAYLFADGNDVSRVTVTMTTGTGVPLSGLHVSFAAAGCSVTQPPGPTDANGQATAAITTRTPGTYAVTVNVKRGDFSATLPITQTLAFYADGENIPTMAGEPADVQLLPRVSGGPARQNYSGTVVFTTTDPQATLPGPQSFTSADAGHRILGGAAIFKTAGLQTLSGRDSITGAEVVHLTYRVTAGSASIIALNPSQDSFATGTPFSVRARVQDVYGNPTVDYNGTVALLSHDMQAVLPAAHAYTMMDAGEYTFDGLQLHTAGMQRLTAADTKLSILNGAVLLTARPGPVAAFALSGDGNAVAGMAYAATIQAQDAYGNPVDDYTGTLALSTGDPDAVAPTRVQVTTGGSQTFTATFRAAGLTTLHFSDAALGLSRDAQLQVVGGAFDHLAWAGLPSVVAAGRQWPLALQAFDSFGNLSSLYRGIVNVSISDPAGTLSMGSVNFNSANAGSATLSAVFKSRGPQTLSASDQVTRVNATAATTVQSGAVTQQLSIGGMPATVVAGQSFNVILQAVDAYGNAQTDYAATVRLQVNDPNAVAPASVVFTAPNNGNVSVPVTLYTQGARTLTATDAGQGTITGSAQTAVRAAAAAALTFVRGPGAPQACVPFPQSVAVGAVDVFGNAVPLTNPVTLSLAAQQNVARPPQLGGNLNQTLASGAANFDNLSIAQGGGPYRLQASATGLQSAQSAPFAVATPAPTVTNAQVTGTGGVVAIAFHASSACPIGYAVTYDPNQSGAFLAASRVPGSPPSQNLRVGTTGADLTWQWDSAIDVPLLSTQGLSLRVVVTTGDTNTTTLLNNLTLNNRVGPAMPRALSHVTSAPTSLALADLNHDGASETLGCDTTGRVRIFRGGSPRQATPAGTTTVTLGHACTAVRSADLNRDGALDVLAVEPDGATVEVLLATSPGTFGAPTSISSGTPYDAAVADINRDGILDLVTVNYHPGSSIAWAFGDGNGGFGSFQTTAVSDYATQLHVKDINHDGSPDAATLSPASQKIDVALGTGTGFGAALTPLPTGANPVAIALGNFNDIGRMDLVVAYDANIVLWFGNDDGTFGNAQTYPSVSGTNALVMADVNRDGVLDAVLGNNHAATAWTILPGVRGRGFGAAYSIPYSTGLTAARVEDLDHDGNVDLLGMGTDGNLVMAPGTAPASARHGLYGGVATNTSANIDFIETGDFTEDGFTDVIAYQEDTTLRVYAGDGAGAMRLVNTMPLISAPSCVAVADLNADGHLDFVSTNLFNGEVDINLGVGDGTFRLMASLYMGNGVSYVTTADFDEDGKTDLAVTIPGDAVVVTLSGDGRGNFRQRARITTDLDPVGVTAGDVNGDGHTDMVSLNGAFTSASTMFGDGQGNFAPAITAAPASGGGLCGQRAFLRDFDHDGKPDLILNCDGLLMVQRGDGTGNFANNLTSANGGWGTPDFDVGDLNGDGWVDATTPGVAAVFRINSRQGWLQSTPNYAPDWGAGRLVDMNGDGTLDLVGTLFGRIYVVFNPGNATLPNPQALPDVVYDPQNVAAADFDGDGYQDIILAHSGDAAASPARVLQMRVFANAHRRSFTSAQYLDAPTGNFGTGFVATADVNHDGWPDVFTLDDYSQGFVWWMNQGRGVFDTHARQVALGGASSLVLHDMTGDGNSDMVTGSWQSGVAIAPGNGDGTFQAATGVYAGSAPTGWFAVGDLDHNGAPDLVTTDHGTVVVQLLDIAGHPIGGTPSSTYPLTGASLVYLGDLNLDATLDAVVAYTTGIGGFALALGAGDGTFGMFTPYPVDPNSYENSVRGIVIGDLTSDGLPDIGVSFDSSGFALYPALAPGVLGAPEYLGTCNASGRSGIIADFDNDGYFDVAVTNPGYSQVLTLFSGR